MHDGPRLDRTCTFGECGERYFVLDPEGAVDYSLVNDHIHVHQEFCLLFLGGVTRGEGVSHFLGCLILLVHILETESIFLQGGSGHQDTPKKRQKPDLVTT